MNVAVQVKYNRMPKLCSKIVLNVYMCPNWKLCTYAVCSKIFGIVLIIVLSQLVLLDTFLGLLDQK